MSRILYHVLFTMCVSVYVGRVVTPINEITHLVVDPTLKRNH